MNGFRLIVHSLQPRSVVGMFDISRGGTIGCTGTDIVLADRWCSPRHAHLTVTEDGEIYIEDLDSTNGIYIDGKRVLVARLHVGNRILIGSHLLEIIAGGESC